MKASFSLTEIDCLCLGRKFMEGNHQGMHRLKIGWPPRSWAHNRTSLSLVFLPHMPDDIETYVQTCLICQQYKIYHQLLAQLLEPLPLASRIWESGFMDFIMALLKYEGCESTMVVVNCYSKYATFIATPVHCKDDEVAYLFIKHVVKL